MKTLAKSLFLMSLVALSTRGVVAAKFDFSGQVAAELRTFFQDAQFPEQHDGVQPSVIFIPEIRVETDNEAHKFVFTPYLRLDARDDERTHFDLREAYWRYTPEGWEIVVGVNRVFWGVTESRHLVDIINQTDSVEDVDEEDKLGQQMVSVSMQKSWGNITLYLLPGFRERTFPGKEGRLRSSLAVNQDSARYESSSGRKHIDYAARYSHYFGDWDIGVSYFHGTSREPILTVDESGSELIPYYVIINQVGTDLQYTKGAWLWKFEGILREGQLGTFAAAVAGFEYTLYQVFNGAADLGLLFEYLYDGRGDEAPITVLDHDLFFGARLALNDTQDTQLLAGTIIDHSHGSTAVSVEFERRIAEHLKLGVESRHFLNTSRQNSLEAFRADDFTALRLSWYF